VAVGWVTAKSLISTYGHGNPEIPVLQMIGYVVLMAVAGMVAAVLPARRATRALDHGRDGGHLTPAGLGFARDQP
jgi:ABC-type antimicrobial peptide transport system permease subunit